MFRFANQLILKSTRDCNLRCEYCYIKNKDNYKGEMIDFELYKKTINRIARERYGEVDAFNIVFHGGEPTLIPKKQMIKMLTYAEKIFHENKINYSFGMQSNLTLIDEEWCQILSKWNISLGCSFDGVGDANEKRTKTIKEKTFYKKFDLLKEYNVNIGFLMVIHEGNINNVIESANFLRDNYGIKIIKANYVEDINGIGGEVTGKEFFEKVWKLFLDEYIETFTLREGNTSHLLSKFITDFLTNYTNTEKTNCGSKICGGGMSIVEMEADGEFQFCGRYSSNFKEARVENVKDKDFLALKQLSRYTDFIREKHEVILNAGCDTCIADGICDHGCMAFYYSKFGKWGIRTDLTCDIHKSFYKYGVKNIKKLLNAIYNELQEEGIARYMLSSIANSISASSILLEELRNEYGLSISIDNNNSRVMLIRNVINEQKASSKK